MYFPSNSVCIMKSIKFATGTPTQFKIMTKASIFIAGAGGIGRATALLLAESNAMDSTVYLGDINPKQIDNALHWMENAPNRHKVHGVVMPTGEIDSPFTDVLQNCDVLLDCLPGSFAPQMAQLALEHDMHYANLTEYVNETDRIKELAKNATRGFVLQTGLAPGYINVLAHKLYQNFTRDHDSNAESLQMKVGALSKNASSPHHYAFTWSPIGVATEYVKDAIIVRDHQRQLVPALSGRGLITIDGTVYEDNFTSGGAANLPSAFADKIKNIDYKTLRYPGHYAWVEKMLSEIPLSENRSKKLCDIMLNNIPVVDDDIVVIYAAVSGRQANGLLRNYEKSLTIKPTIIGNTPLRAIQSTTAAPLCEIAYQLVKNNMSGITLQTDINCDEFLNGPFVSMVYGSL